MKKYNATRNNFWKCYDDTVCSVYRTVRDGN